ncbi:MULTISPECIES: hypothetical protein [unclassified Tenacibaculum]|uniref:hypothetical protein n=1 Tax=unclassified Tenacibaculum TaxID=2635139 RepID=UPI001F3A8F92|nr:MULTISPECIES: hypothetical protein [unclassified Tenacibaculum]MCF2873128.1 hypothetical protein [Tenacibaculum sp. Cn5-1]MCF2933284.1 hypothetical protein [Tenacibaculum sp. Cn5-34]MCG7510135.1 hypothetical protein [Tenacibaculum sp. Cn5-46]
MKKTAPITVELLKTDGYFFKIKLSHLEVPITVNKEYYDSLIKNSKDYKII